MKNKWRQLVTLLSVAASMMALVWVIGGLASADHGDTVIDFDNLDFKFDVADQTEDGFVFASDERITLESEEGGDGDGQVLVLRTDQSIENRRSDGGTFDALTLNVPFCTDPCIIDITEWLTNDSGVESPSGIATADPTPEQLPDTIHLGFSGITMLQIEMIQGQAFIDDIVTHGDFGGGGGLKGDILNCKQKGNGNGRENAPGQDRYFNENSQAPDHVCNNNKNK